MVDKARMSVAIRSEKTKDKSKFLIMTLCLIISSSDGMITNYSSIIYFFLKKAGMSNSSSISIPLGISWSANNLLITGFSILVMLV